MAAKWLRTVASTLLRVTVLVVSLMQLVMMFNRGGWWIAAALLWLPLNWAVAKYYGDLEGPVSAETHTFD